MGIKLLTSPEVAEALSIEEQTLATWRHHRVGPPYLRIGRAIRYREDDVEAYLVAVTVESERLETNGITKRPRPGVAISPDAPRLTAEV